MSAATKALIYQTSTSVGTGNFTLNAIVGWRQFGNSDAFGTGVTLNVFYYYIRNQIANEWEFGTGHMSASTTLVRDTVILSSNANAAVSFSAGTKDVSCDIPMPSAFAIGILLANDACAAIAALGLGTIATQNANAVNITGGTLAGVNFTNSMGTLNTLQVGLLTAVQVATFQGGINVLTTTQVATLNATGLATLANVNISSGVGTLTSLQVGSLLGTSVVGLAGSYTATQAGTATASAAALDYSGGIARIVAYGSGANYSAFEVVQAHNDGTSARTPIRFETNGQVGFDLGLDISGVSADLRSQGSAGTTGQLLQSQGPGIPPSWQTIATGSGTVTNGNFGGLAYYSSGDAANIVSSTLAGTQGQRIMSNGASTAPSWYDEAPTDITTGTTSPAAGGIFSYRCDPSGGAITVDLTNKPVQVLLLGKPGSAPTATNYVRVKPPSGKRVFAQTADDTVTISRIFHSLILRKDSSDNYS